MYALEVLQNCPSQKQALLSAIGGIDPIDSNLVVFNHTGYVPQLLVELTFFVQVIFSITLFITLLLMMENIHTLFL